MKEIQEEVRICEDFVRLQDEAEELKGKFWEKYEEFSRTQQYNDKEDELLKKIFYEIVMKKMPYKCISFILSQEEMNKIYQKAKLDIEKVVFSKKGVGVKYIYKTNLSYDISHQRLKSIWEVIGERVKGLLGDNGIELDNFFNFVENKGKGNLVYYEKLNPEEESKVREIIKISNKILKEDEDINLNPLYLIVKQGRIQIIQNEETDEKLADRLDFNSYFENTLMLDERDLKNILFSCAFKDRLNLTFDRWRSLVDKRIKERDERIFKVKEHYKDELMLLELKESNKNGN